MGFNTHGQFIYICHNAHINMKPLYTSELQTGLCIQKHADSGMSMLSTRCKAQGFLSYLQPEGVNVLLNGPINLLYVRSSSGFHKFSSNLNSARLKCTHAQTFLFEINTQSMN